MSPAGFSHVTPAFRTYSGPDALLGLGRELAKADAQRIVLIGSPSVLRRADAIEPVREVVAGRIAAEFDGVQEHSPIPAVEHARAVLAESDADAVLVVGGGSAIVTARAAAVLHAEGGAPRDWATRREGGRLVSPRLNAPKLPIWIVPSTPTTAYAKAGSAVRDPETGERLALFDPKTRAQGVVFDPGMAATAPVGLVRSATYTSLSTAVEGLQAAGADPLADALLAHALRICLDELPRLDADGDDVDARLALMSAALLAGQGGDYARGGLAQGLSHTIGPRSEVANGVVEAMLLPATLRFEAAPDARFPLLARGLDAPEDAAGLADRLAEVLAGLGLPTRLRDVGVDADALPDLVAHALDDWAIASRPRPLSSDELLDLLTAAW